MIVRGQIPHPVSLFLFPFARIILKPCSHGATATVTATEITFLHRSHNSKKMGKTSIYCDTSFYGSAAVVNIYIGPISCDKIVTATVNWSCNNDSICD